MRRIIYLYSVFLIISCTNNVDNGVLRKSVLSNEEKMKEQSGYFGSYFPILYGVSGSPAFEIHVVSKSCNNAQYEISIKDFNKYIIDNNVVKTDAFNGQKTLLVQAGELFHIKPFLYHPDSISTELLFINFEMKINESLCCAAKKSWYLNLDSKIEYMRDTLYKFRISGLMDDSDLVYYVGKQLGIVGIAYCCTDSEFNKSKIMSFCGFIPDYDCYYFQHNPGLTCESIE